MSKPKAASTELSVVNENKGAVTIPGDFLGSIAEFAEVSKSDFTAEDVITPSIRVLQGLSPQVKKASPTYVTGAEEGMLFNTANNELYDGGKGIVVIPCFFNREWVEWKPKNMGGGLVKKWGKDESFKNEGYTDEKGKWVKKSKEKGNEGKNELEIVNTANYCVLLINLVTMSARPCMIRLSSTEFKKSRRWNSLIDSIEICDQAGKPLFKKDGSLIQGNEIPFWYMYHITTVPESNESGSWFGFRIEKYKPLHEMPNCQSLMKQAVEFRKLGMEGSIKTIEQTQDEVELESDDPNKL